MGTHLEDIVSSLGHCFGSIVKRAKFEIIEIVLASHLFGSLESGGSTLYE